MRLFWIVSFALITFGAAPALACDYCADLEKLKSSFAKVKPEPLNHGTIDQQTKLVDEASTLLKKAMKVPKKLGSADWNRLLPFLGTVVTYDYQNLTADELLPLLGSDHDYFFAEVTKAEKTGALSRAAADEIRIAFSTAEAVQEDAKSQE